MELMEESLENRLKNKRMAFTAEENDFTMIPISLMINWLRKPFLSKYSEKRLARRFKNLLFSFLIFKTHPKDALPVEWFLFRVKELFIAI